VRILYLTFDDLTRPFAWTVHVRAIVNRLVARGHAIRLLAPGGSAPGVDAPCDPIPPGRLHHLFGSLGTFVRAGRDFGPEALYVRGIHLTRTPAKAAERLGRPLVIELNGLLENEIRGFLRRAAIRASHRFALARAARVVTVSPLLRQALAERYGFPSERVDVVPNGADTSLFRPGDPAEARRRLGLPLDRPIVLCVASFYPHHALEVLLRAVTERDAVLVLVGAEGPVPAGVVSTGPLPHERVPEYVQAADVCVFTFRAPDPRLGCSPVKLYEYMAGGRAVAVSTDMEETRRFVEEHGIGLAVPLDPEALSKAIGRLLADPAERNRMGQRGRALAESTYNWDRAASQVEESLRKAAAGRPGESP
jgi:glycosyltransferase involved in cell wall biosynthesis